MMATLAWHVLARAPRRRAPTPTPTAGQASPAGRRLEAGRLGRLRRAGRGRGRQRGWATCRCRHADHGDADQQLCRAGAVRRQPGHAGAVPGAAGRADGWRGCRRATPPRWRRRRQRRARRARRHLAAVHPAVVPHLSPGVVVREDRAHARVQAGRTVADSRQPGVLRAGDLGRVLAGPADPPGAGRGRPAHAVAAARRRQQRLLAQLLRHPVHRAAGRARRGRLPGRPADAGVRARSAWASASACRTWCAISSPA